jgi:hypothetical protein
MLGMNDVTMVGCWKDRPTFNIAPKECTALALLERDEPLRHY